MANPLIKLEDVNLYYDRGKPSEVHALKNLSMEVERGDYVAFFGPSGCGKTTLLYLISGIDIGKLTSGKVVINGKDITSFSAKELAIFRQIGIGIVFQQFNLIPSVTVAENVALPMAFLGISPSRRREEALKLLDRLAIKNLADRYPSELSGGQQQRVGIARALANNPPVIIADEPLGNLDSENANRALEFLRELNEKDKRTIVMVTHEAWSLRDAKKIFYMKDGEILKVERPQKKENIAKSVSSFLYSNMHPGISSAQLMAKALANMFMRGYTAEEIKRFEFFLGQRLAGKIDSEIFEKILDRPFKEGGVGLWRGKAKKINKSIADLMAERKTAEDIYAELEKNPETPLFEETRRLRQWLVSEYKGKVSDLQKIQLDEAISERLRGIITPENFRLILNLSKTKSGIGLSMRTATTISEKLEAILQKSPMETGDSLSNMAVSKL